MRYYEISILISPELSEKELNSLEEKIFSFIQENNGLIVKTNKIVKKTLGYPIKKKNEAFFLNFDFQLQPENIEKIKMKLKKEPTILRFLLLNKKLTLIKGLETKKPKKISQSPKVELKNLEEKLEEILTE